MNEFYHYFNNVILNNSEKEIKYSDLNRIINDINSNFKKDYIKSIKTDNFIFYYAKINNYLHGLLEKEFGILMSQELETISYIINYDFGFRNKLVDSKDIFEAYDLVYELLLDECNSMEELIEPIELKKIQRRCLFNENKNIQLANFLEYSNRLMKSVNKNYLITK